MLTANDMKYLNRQHVLKLIDPDVRYRVEKLIRESAINGGTFIQVSEMDEPDVYHATRDYRALYRYLTMGGFKVTFPVWGYVRVDW